MDRFVDDGSLDDNVENFLSHDDADPRDTVGRGMDVSKGKCMSGMFSMSSHVNQLPLFLSPKHALIFCCSLVP